MTGTKACLHGFPCLNERYPGSTHCFKHILSDPDQKQFVQCHYDEENGRRCFSVCPISRKEGLCDAHLERYERLRAMAERDEAGSTPSTTLSPNSKEAVALKSYIALKRTSSQDAAVSDTPGLSPPKKVNGIEDQPSFLQSLDADGGTDEDEEAEDTSIFGRLNKEALNVCTSTRDDQEEECPLFGEGETPLARASVMTEEEVLAVTQSKILRLRELYLKEQALLQRSLTERRRRYLQGARREQEQFGNLNAIPQDPERLSPEERLLVEKLRCYKRFGKIRGAEGVLHQRSMDVILKKEPKAASKCVYAPQRGFKCGERTLPSTKYCLKHILHDPCQLLFRPCGFAVPDGDAAAHDDDKCQDPVFPVKGEATKCLLHSSGPEIPHLTITK